MSKLQEIRKERGFTQARLAKEAGISLGGLFKMEQGSRDINKADIKTLLRICNILECRLTDILDDPETLQALADYENR